MLLYMHVQAQIQAIQLSLPAHVCVETGCVYVCSLMVMEHNTHVHVTGTCMYMHKLEQGTAPYPKDHSPQPLRPLPCNADLSNTLQPCVQGIASHLQIRLVELVFLGPALWGISQPLLDDGMEPGQQEVQASSLVRLLAHACGRHSAECAD